MRTSREKITSLSMHKKSDSYYSAHNFLRDCFMHFHWHLQKERNRDPTPLISSCSFKMYTVLTWHVQQYDVMNESHNPSKITFLLSESAASL